jgi:hypothetical protein
MPSGSILAKIVSAGLIPLLPFSFFNLIPLVSPFPLIKERGRLATRVWIVLSYGHTIVGAPCPKRVGYDRLSSSATIYLRRRKS